MNKEPTENFRIKEINERTGKVSIRVGICCRLPDLEEQAGEIFYKQIETASCLKALALVGVIYAEGTTQEGVSNPGGSSVSPTTSFSSK